MAPWFPRSQLRACVLDGTARQPRFSSMSHLGKILMRTLLLLGGAITILKNDGVRQWEGLYDYAMFETTNQSIFQENPWGFRLRLRCFPFNQSRDPLFSSLIYLFKIVIFHSYVSLPEGIWSEYLWILNSHCGNYWLWIYIYISTDITVIMDFKWLYAEIATISSISVWYQRKLSFDVYIYIILIINNYYHYLLLYIYG